MVPSKKIQILLALIVFVIAFAIRIPLVDNLYKYSFEADSESCVEVTRSFYFFFQHPVMHNAPHTLTSYPNYSDGPFITSAIVANIAAPLCKAGIITAPLTDSDNSLVIFAMRWTGVLLDALSAAIAFIIILLIARNGWVAFAICLLVYVLNPHTLNIDFMRVDHFLLFSGNLAALAAVLLFKYPDRKRYYLLAGISMGLVSATKINFPFYLVILFLVFCYLLWNRRLTFLHTSLFIISFLLAAAFMYQRWLMYPENIAQVAMETYAIGVEWTLYWGNDRIFYYLWDEFFNHGFAIGVVLMLLAFYTALAVSIKETIRRKDALAVILLVSFLLQTIALMLSPKVGRYGILMPLWVGIFLAYGFVYLSQKVKLQGWHRFITAIMVVLLIPYFLYAGKDYLHLVEASGQRKQSIIDTRIKPYDWVRDHVMPGSVIAYQHPRVSQPPIFDLPLVFTEAFSYRFLQKDAALSFHPPSFSVLETQANYYIVTDKERNYHFFTLADYGADSTMVKEWQQFYDSLDIRYPHRTFSSPYPNYALKEIKIYTLNKQPYGKAPSIANCCHDIKGNQLQWTIDSLMPMPYYSFHVQISADSAMQWLVYGSSDGVPSKYRAEERPVLADGKQYYFIPEKLRIALDEGEFGGNQEGDPFEKELFFYTLLSRMTDDSLTLRQAAAAILGEEGAQVIYSGMDSLYGRTSGIMDLQAAGYVQAAKLNVDISALRNDGGTERFVFKMPEGLKPGKRYYWRIRLKYKEQIMSDWSDIRAITTNEN